MEQSQRWRGLTLISIEQQSFLLVLAVAAVAPMVADLVPKLQLPLIALELVFGILIGPQVLGWVQPVPALTPLVRLGIA